jgi:hypothetical protein
MDKIAMRIGRLGDGSILISLKVKRENSVYLRGKMQRCIGIWKENFVSLDSGNRWR